MNFRRIGIPILIGLILCLAPPDAYGGASDTWAKQKKVLIGEFNNGAEQLMSGPDSNGLYRYEVRLYPGTAKYTFGVILNGTTDTQYEFGSKTSYRQITIPTGVDTFYVPTNWADFPPSPTNVTTSIVGVGQVKLTWTEPTPGGLDVAYGGGYHVYYRAGSAGPPWTQADTQLLTTTAYTVSGLTVGTVYHFIITAVDAYDTPGVPSTDSPAPPGPYTSTSAVVTDTPMGKVIVQFIVDLRKEIAKVGAPPFGMGIGGSQPPLSWRPYEQPLREVQPGIWTETYEMQAGQKLDYKYVKNPGTSKQEWEGQGDKFPVLFRFDPATWGLNAKNVSEVYVRGSFYNDFSLSSDWKMTLESDSVFRLVKSIRDYQTYKYFVYHTGAPNGDWIPGGDNLSVTPSDVSTQFVYGPDTMAVAVWITGSFDPWANNNWLGSKADDFYALTADNRKVWRLARNMPNGTHKYKFIIDNTNDGVKNGNYESGNDRTLEVTGNRQVTIAANYGPASMRVVDVWEQAGLAPPNTPVSITAVSMDTSVLLSWRPSSDFMVNAYNVYRDTDKNGKFKLIATVPGAAYPEYIDSGLVNGKTYYYKITSYDTSSLLESKYSLSQEGMPAAGGAVARRMADGQDSSVTIVFPSGSIPVGSYVRITSFLEALQEQSNDTDMGKMMTLLSGAEAAQQVDPLEWALSENTAGDSDSLIYMIELRSKTTGSTVTLADTPVKISIPYTAAQEQYASAGGQKVSGFALYVLNEKTGRWDPVPGSTTNAASRMVGAPRYQFSIFQVMALAGAPNNLSDMVVFPNPVYPNRGFAQRGDPFGDGRAGATFINIPTDIEFIKIYTITGELVRTLDPNDAREYNATGTAVRMIWDLQNDAGAPVASGVYIFYAKSGTSNRTGKVAVIR